MAIATELMVINRNNNGLTYTPLILRKKVMDDLNRDLIMIGIFKDF